MSPLTGPPALEIDRIIRMALEEDLGDAGDLTSCALVPETTRARGVIRAEAPLIAAGVGVALRVFELLDGTASPLARAQDGDALGPGAELLRLEGPARALLAGERTALNLLGRMCGVATVTRRAVEAVAGTGTRILDTRKTAPGLRALDKYAVRCGGGENHRFGLHDMALIKDNHVAVAGGVGNAVRAAQRALPPGIPLQVEVEDLQGLEEALEAGARLILLDNMDIDTMAAAVRQAAGRAELEASGGIDPDEVGELARRTGVHRISLGALTRGTAWAEVSMDLEERGS